MTTNAKQVVQTNLIQAIRTGSDQAIIDYLTKLLAELS